MNEKPKEKIEDLKKVAGGTDSGIDYGSGQDPSDPVRPGKQPDLGTGGKDPGFGDTSKPDK